ncbi:MAG TPA: hypothetical protein VFY16_11410 [Gemmatimonadaceae bacterium]|nr:hypothetical protein [Gemmatimonadaceae bacterium]
MHAPRSAIRAGCLLACLLTACGRTRDTSTPRDNARAAAPGQPPAGATRVRGTLLGRGDTSRFRACGDSVAAIVVDDSGSTLARAYDALAGGAPLDSTYAELRVRQRAPGDPYVVVGVERVTPVGEGGGCDRPPFTGEYLARGNEPFWAVEVSRDGIILRRPGVPDARFPYARPRTEEGRRVYETTAADGPRLRLVLTPERCADSMSGEQTAWRAAVELDGERMAGCAATGTAVP